MLSLLVSIWDVGKDIKWQQSLCHLSQWKHSVLPSPQSRVCPSDALCLLHNPSSVRDSGWVPLLPPALLWKQPNLKHTPTLAYPCVNTHIYTPGPTSKPIAHHGAAGPMGNLTPFLPLTIMVLPIRFIENTCKHVHLYASSTDAWKCGSTKVILL